MKRRRIQYIFCTCLMCMTLTNIAMAAPTTAAQESIIEESSMNPAETPQNDLPITNMENTVEETIDTSDEQGDDITSLDTVPETTVKKIEETETEINEETELESDNIIVEDDNRLDDEGRVSVKATFPDDAVFPYTITLKGKNGDVQFTIQKNEQELLIKPDVYTVKEATNGKGKKLPKGAELQITDTTDAIYLDFTKPQKFTDVSFTSVTLVNLAFLIVVGIAYVLFKKFKNSLSD